MKRILLASCFSCLSAFAFSQHEGHDHSKDSHAKTASLTDAKATPQAAVAASTESLVLKEEVYDFGKIPQGKPVTHVFEVLNAGKTAMKINNVQASCGCTTPEWEKDKDIPAGASSKITVGYNAAAEGPFTKFITVTYGDNQSKQITIKGEVWKTPAASAPENTNINELKD